MSNSKKHLKGTPEEKSKAKIKSGAGELSAGISGFLKTLADLRPGLDRAGTIIRIRDNREMKGANAWLLMCSIMVASLGLDLDSPAVIIGAMLISPLMSPILGIGLSIGIEDRDMLRNSLFHLIVAIGIALLTSFIYFRLSPLGNYTAQIDARTAPTLLDVMIAFFGGIAGIVSGSRKDQSNAIPGVAIATALMPPLCVTGYGLANAEWEIMVKSFYLFFINATFVALATYLIVRFLKFPQRTYRDATEKRKTHFWMIVFSIILILPSIFIMKTVYQKIRQKQKVEVYMNKKFAKAYWNWDKNNITSSEEDSMKVVLFLPGNVEQDSLAKIRTEFENLQCSANLKLVQTDLANEEFDANAFGISIEKKILKSLQKENNVISEKDQKIIALTAKLDSLNSDQTFFNNMTKEARTLFPKLEEIGFARIRQTNFDTSFQDMPTFILTWNKSKRRAAKNADKQKLYNWIKYRAKLDTLQILEK